MEKRRYSFYLRPSFAMSRAQVEMHQLLSQQYGLQTAGKFMPHTTVKGFFRSNASPDEIVSLLTPALSYHQPFIVYNNGVHAYGKAGIVLRIQHIPHGARNAALQALHQTTLNILLPLVHPQCNFTPVEWCGERFDAHLTLAMADIPPQHFDEILDFVREAEPIGPPSFVAHTLQLFAFTSENWSGAWWQSLQWELLYSWRLQDT
ncbi:MAG: 2'-5' RNA ligase [Chloroflexi bacterium AL-W]|nr:2'-5' RNA ligase [Chloroflexi bacterium AL-N1]NOK66178.1 2'-5' RNA ligase [Chloroflexi bacterium AL-N10]NOK73059.1 2'-5' RNA ligase [Chloroflexi bacterium AL-N5]NOK79956.1 2'-5' RNA ligase [Chloroflexi bacterium AL-W]NOK88188.1 2'-5' RNA ligase [Chloroflexi bacterium AL-N15]